MQRFWVAQPIVLNGDLKAAEIFATEELAWEGAERLLREPGVTEVYVAQAVGKVVKPVIERVRFDAPTVPMFNPAKIRDEVDSAEWANVSIFPRTG